MPDFFRPHRGNSEVTPIAITYSGKPWASRVRLQLNDKMLRVREVVISRAMAANEPVWLLAVDLGPSKARRGYMPEQKPEEGIALSGYAFWDLSISLA